MPSSLFSLEVQGLSCYFNHQTFAWQVKGSSGFNLRPETESELCLEMPFTVSSYAIESTSPAAVTKITMVIKSDVYSAQKTWHTNCTGWSILCYCKHTFTSLFFKFFSVLYPSNTVKVLHCEICHPHHSGEILAQLPQWPWPDCLTLHNSVKYVCICVGNVLGCVIIQMFAILWDL